MSGLFRRRVVRGGTNPTRSVRRPLGSSRVLFALASIMWAAAGVVAPVAEAAAPVNGGGSTFSQIAVDQWRSDVARTKGLQVNYAGLGSSQGRQQFRTGTLDFASSDIPFEATEQPVGRAYTYVPLVAGGTALMYNLKDAAGRQITNLQLSGPTITKIFTGGIRRWRDGAVLTDNPGIADRIPDEDIKQVVRSGGSGTSAVFTGYMAAVDGGTWAGFASQYGIVGGFTSSFPDVPGFIKQAGSDGIANFVANPNAGRSSIGYAEAGYAKQRGLPMAYVKNASGNWTIPTARAVAIALLDAKRNPDGTQDLSKVYFNGNQESYSISSYNYAIIPTDNSNGFSKERADTLGQFVAYCITEGQSKAAQLGYSPLPPNLVQQGLDEIQKGKDAGVGYPQPPPLGSFGQYYLQLGVTSGNSQPPPNPQGNGTVAGTGGGPGKAGSGPAASSGPSAGDPRGPGASGASGESGATGADAEGSAETGDTAVGSTEGSGEVAAPSGLKVDAAGRVVSETGAESVLPGTTAAIQLMVLIGLLVFGVVFAPPILSSARTSRASGRAWAAHRGQVVDPGPQAPSGMSPGSSIADQSLPPPPPPGSVPVDLPPPPRPPPPFDPGDGYGGATRSSSRGDGPATGSAPGGG